MNVEITIPKASVEPVPKPHTIYHITIRLPLRSFSITKRYSDFTTLNDQLTQLVGLPPPASLPPKTYFSSSVSNPELTETRRVALEDYLQKIAGDLDSRWRASPAWRQFLNLPSTQGNAPQHPAIPVKDPVLWLDFHRELKSLLQDARFELSRRDQATSTGEQHDASASVKKNLVKASTLLGVLDAGIREETELGEGEIRRRKDLVAAAKNERDALEALANSIAKRSESPNPSTISLKSTASRNAQPARTGRVLGGPLPETERTRELDNKGVLQLQQQIMSDQNEGLEVLLKSVQRQKQMGVDIGQELDYQNELLETLDADVDRVDGKLRVVSKRMNKIK